MITRGEIDRIAGRPGDRRDSGGDGELIGTPTGGTTSDVRWPAAAPGYI
jgi:hypothetical protein